MFQYKLGKDMHYLLEIQVFEWKKHQLDYIMNAICCWQLVFLIISTRKLKIVCDKSRYLSPWPGTRNSIGAVSDKDENGL